MQRWRELAAQISPSIEKKQMTKIFLKTLSSCYYERMIASAPNDFTEMVNMGMGLEEGVREGILSREEASNSKKYGGGFSKKKDGETNTVSVERRRKRYIKKSSISHQQKHQVSSIITVYANNYVVQLTTVRPQ